MAQKTNRLKARRKMLFYVCMMVLPCLQFFIFWVCVNANSLLLAFRRYDYDEGFLWAGLDNFIQVIKDFGEVEFFGKSVRNSLIVYAFSLFLSTPLSVLFAFYLSKKLRGSGLFKTVLFLPHILSSLIMVILFKYFVDRAIPEVYEQLTGNTMQGLLANMDTTFSMIVFYNIWTGFGTSTMMYLGAMSGISDSVVEAAELDGVTPLKELWYITVPMIWPTFMTFVVVGFTGLFTNQINLYNFYGDQAEYRYYTFGYYLYISIRNASIGEYPYLAALGLLLTAVAAPLTLLLRKAMNKFGPKTI